MIALSGGQSHRLRKAAASCGQPPAPPGAYLSGILTVTMFDTPEPRGPRGVGNTA